MNLLQQGLADTLRNATMDLPFEGHWIENRAYVIDRNIALDGNRPGLDIDLHFANMTPLRKGWRLRRKFGSLPDSPFCNRNVSQ